MKLIKETVDEFFDIPIGITEDLIQDLADGLGHLFQDYISFAASCGKTQIHNAYTPPSIQIHLCLILQDHSSPDSHFIPTGLLFLLRNL